MMADLFALIDPRLVLVVTACWVFGYSLKRTPKIPDWSIIWLVTALALVLTVLILGLSAESVVQGILTGAAAVYGNQLYKQTMERDKKDP
ncbi:phage holin family protein [Paenibacillus aurantius]|uniref:Phage holin family protein n=1 Tax=Paenibacillus aurantius TaxID=2918900 RepID=A0AA96LK36_9BACL|nr:phage holin family protein [Paenibacillus aurantius]WJH33104.1 phage holin family protein [Paenibacillus sp. CC-CFT747]WNQ13550.1 phage holin family protein [Paenibacillus aurantius]